MLTYFPALVLFFSKSLLRHPLARSNIEDFTGDSHFRWVIPDPAHESPEIAERAETYAIDAPEKIERVIICTGQAYAAIHKYRSANKITSAAITRVEQLNPFPWKDLKDNLDMYPNAKTIVWAQEEPLNAGPWSFMQPRIETLLNNTEHHHRKHVMYAGRAPSASVATGLKGTHMKEEQDLLEMAFTVKQDKLKGA